MIWFWIAAALVSAGAAALMVQRAARAAEARGAENPSLAVYRRQMAELDEMTARGVLAEPDRRGVRAEVGRRLLAAADRVEAPGRASRPLLTLIIAAATPLVALGVYVAIGAPGSADQPYARRLQDWLAADPQSLEPQQMAAVLRAKAAERPNDPEPLRYLALAELESNEPTEAEQALQRAILLAPKRADLWAMLGEIQVEQAQGTIDPRARDSFAHAVALDPKSAPARYYLARARIADGDVAGGLEAWRGLEAELAPDDPRRAELVQDIQQVSTTGKLTPQHPVAAQPPSAPSGPVGGPQIQAMVDSLAAQLKAQPDDPAGWVRLVRAYAVLGEADRRDAALAEARRRFAGHADVLAALDQAAHPAP